MGDSLGDRKERPTRRDLVVVAEVNSSSPLPNSSANGGWSGEYKDETVTPLVLSDQLLSAHTSMCLCDECEQQQKRDGKLSGLSVSVRCDCHQKSKDASSKKALRKLIIACCVSLGFMIAEIIGGYLANSLAIMTDAAHMLSDFAGFLISLLSVMIAMRPPSRRMSFGWYRAEVVGAVVSVLIIWVITAVLLYKAVQRFINPDYEIDADIMLITACLGVFVNVFMCGMLQVGGIGGDDDKNKRKKKMQDALDTAPIITADSLEAGDSSDLRVQRKSRKKSAANKGNINIRAAVIHIIGDLIQSIGVVTAGYIIKFKPEWKAADPSCTFLFSILVLFSTFNILKDAIHVLMEGTPRHINYEELKQDLACIPGVKHTHNVYIWSLTLNKIALAAHLTIEPGANYQEILTMASRLAKDKYGVTETTLQVENHRHIMDRCTKCQQLMKPKMRTCF